MIVIVILGSSFCAFWFLFMNSLPTFMSSRFLWTLSSSRYCDLVCYFFSRIFASIITGVCFLLFILMSWRTLHRTLKEKFSSSVFNYCLKRIRVSFYERFWILICSRFTKLSCVDFLLFNSIMFYCTLRNASKFRFSNLLRL